MSAAGFVWVAERIAPYDGGCQGVFANLASAEAFCLKIFPVMENEQDSNSWFYFTEAARKNATPGMRVSLRRVEP